MSARNSSLLTCQKRLAAVSIKALFSMRSLTMLQIMRVLTPIAFGLFLTSCVSNSSAPRAFEDAVTNVYIGMSKTEFESVMREVNEKTKRRLKRRSEAYKRNGSLYEISYIRSGWVSDGASTDDEYTPYLFQDGTLIGYGWTAVGGKKTDSADIARAKAGATRVDVKQTTNVDTRPKDYFKCKKDGGDSYFC